eukprot:scaffold141583_cov160-Phaeocystis_antarctica.AAC.1
MAHSAPTHGAQRIERARRRSKADAEDCEYTRGTHRAGTAKADAEDRATRSQDHWLLGRRS